MVNAVVLEVPFTATVTQGAECTHWAKSWRGMAAIVQQMGTCLLAVCKGMVRLRLTARAAVRVPEC